MNRYLQRIKKLILVFTTIIIFGIITKECIAQDNYHDDYFNLPHHTIVPSFASPNIEGLGKYVDMPVSLYTGVPQISIPIYTIECKDLTIPISLSYHSSGIKVEEIASWVGLGWSLNAGGAISRSVKGLADDLYEVDNLKNELGVFVNCTDAGYLYSGDIITNFCDNTGDLTENKFWKLSHGGLDGEPDVFYYNFLGYSGKFVFDEQGNVHNFEQNNLKISYSKEPQGEIESFEIVTEEGVILVFATTEATNVIGDNIQHGKLFGFNAAPPYEWQTYVSSWYLSKVILAYSNDSIIFHYENDQIASVRKGREEFRKWESYSPDWYAKVINSGSYFPEKKRLKKIIWNMGEVHLNADHSRQDYNVLVTDPSYDAKALTEVIIKDHEQNTVYSYTLDYSYFQSPLIDINEDDSKEGYYKRLRLDKVYQKDASGNFEGAYIFEYDETPLPHRFSYEQGYWGYYNANYTNGNNPDKTTIPNYYEYPWDSGGVNDIYNDKYLGPYSIFQRNYYSSEIYRDGFANRDPNPEVIQACILKKITYPTGGTHELYYEPNDFYLYDQNITGGGLRISKIIINDNLNPENNITKEYFYTSSENPGNSSGRIINLPQYVKGHKIGSNGQADNSVIYSTSLAGLGNTHGSFVGYEEVIVKLSGNGEKYCKYNIPATFGIDTSNCTNQTNCIYNRTISETRDYMNTFIDYVESNFPYPPDPNFDWNRGLLLEEKTFNEDELLVKHTSNKYDIKNYKKVNALFVKDLSWMSWGSYFYYWHKYGRYYYLSGWLSLVESTKTIYDNNGENGVTQTTEFYYENPSHKQVTKKQRSKSTGQIDKVEYYYPADISNYAEVFTTSNIIDSLISHNLVSKLIKAERYNGADRIAGALNSFNVYNGNYDIVRASASYNLQGNTYTLNSQIDDYDEFSNVLQHHEDQGNLISYYWAYNNQYPVVKAENVSYPDLETEILSIQSNMETFLADLDDLSDETDRQAWKSFNTSLRQQLPEAFINTYTYKPLVGLSSETDINSNTTYYFYNDFGRPETIKDKNNKVVKHFDYNYKNFYLDASPETFDMSHLANYSVVNISSNMDWSVAENEDWLTISAPGTGNGDGSFTFYNSALSGQNDRTGIITLTSSRNTIDISIIQHAAPYLNTSHSSLYFLHPGSKEVTVTSNVVWTANSNESWISVTILPGEIAVTCSDNDTDAQRTGSVTVSGSNVPDVEITVTQVTD